MGKSNKPSVTQKPPRVGLGALIPASELTRPRPSAASFSPYDVPVAPKKAGIRPSPGPDAQNDVSAHLAELQTSLTAVTAKDAVPFAGSPGLAAPVTVESASAVSPKKRGSLTLPADLSHLGFLRLEQVLQLIPMSRASWYQGILDGRHPKPVKIGMRSVAWSRAAIVKLIEDLNNEAAASVGPVDLS